jgi:hypothetical protein
MGVLTAVVRARAARQVFAGWALACVAGSLLLGCIGESPEQADADALGPDTSGYRNGPFHRAGFPCTRCHGDLWWQDSPSFELAGTVYRKPADRAGVSGAEVIVQDAAGHELRALTNRSGNFFFVREGSQARQLADGRFALPYALTYPLRVRVALEGHEQNMRGQIWREPSCATCHRGEPGSASNGPILALEEDSP